MFMAGVHAPAININVFHGVSPRTHQCVPGRAAVARAIDINVVRGVYPSSKCFITCPHHNTRHKHQCIPGRALHTHQCVSGLAPAAHAININVFRSVYASSMCFMACSHHATRHKHQCISGRVNVLPPTIHIDSRVLTPLVSSVSVDPLHHFSMPHLFQSFQAVYAHPLTKYCEHGAGATRSYDLS